MGKIGISISPIHNFERGVIINPIVHELAMEITDLASEMTKKHGKIAKDALTEILKEVGEDYGESVIVQMDNFSILYTRFPTYIDEEFMDRHGLYTELFDVYLYAFECAIDSEEPVIIVPLEWESSFLYDPSMIVDIAHVCARIFEESFAEIILQTTDSEILKSIGKTFWKP